jgi:hypothetical protein
MLIGYFFLRSSGNWVGNSGGSSPSDIKSVLPDLAWVEAESPAEKIDGGFEMLLVSIATGPAFYGHDLAV